MKRRRRSKAPLPRAPLELAYPLTARAAGPEGGAVLREVPPAHALMVLKALRLVLAWCQGPDVAEGLLRRPEMKAWEEEVLLSRFEEALWAPVATLASELRRPERADPRTISNACFAVSEWALGARAEETALLFTEAAALAWPENARWAWIAGRLFRNLGRFREGELWLKRAIRVAVWNDDWETQDLALNSLGNLYREQGSLPEALRYLRRAFAVARRHTSKGRAGAVTHDLFAVSILAGESTRAEKLALYAFDLYGPEHPNLPRLAYDIAQFWAHQGRFSIALPVLKALRRYFHRSVDRLKVVTATGRAAGACADAGLFDRMWTEAWEIIGRREPAIETALPGALLDLGFGAASLGQWSRAAEALAAALKGAQDHNVHDTAVQAEAALALARRSERVEYVRREGQGTAAARLSDALVESLEAPSRETESDHETLFRPG